MVHLSFALSITGTYCLGFFCEKDCGGQSVLAVGSHLSMHTCKNDTFTACTWAAPQKAPIKIFT